MNKLHCYHIERDANTDGATEPVDTITLDETDRHRRRLSLTSDNGISFLLELPNATLLREGDILRLTDGRGIEVRATPESLYVVRGRDPVHLLQLTWHVGNRHLATQIMNDCILIRRDSVIRSMLEELGADIDEVTVGFNPVGGAYDSELSASHSPHHSHHPSQPSHQQQNPFSPSPVTEHSQEPQL